MPKYNHQDLVTEYGTPGPKARYEWQKEEDPGLVLDDDIRPLFAKPKKISEETRIRLLFSGRVQKEPQSHEPVDLTPYPRLTEIANRMRTRWDLFIMRHLKGMAHKRHANGNEYNKKLSTEKVQKWIDKDMKAVDEVKGADNWGNRVPTRSLFEKVFIPTAFHLAGNSPKQFEQALELILESWWVLVAPNRYGAGCVGARPGIVESFFALEGGEQCSNYSAAEGQFVYFYQEYGPFIAYLVALFQGQEQDAHYDGGDYSWATYKFKELLDGFKGKDGRPGLGGKNVVRRFVEEMADAHKVRLLPNLAAPLGRMLAAAPAMSKLLDIDRKQVEEAALEIATEHGKAMSYDGGLSSYGNKLLAYDPDTAIAPFDWVKSCAGTLAHQTHSSFVLFWQQLARGEKVGITARIGDTDNLIAYANAERTLAGAMDTKLLDQIFHMKSPEHAKMLGQGLGLLHTAKKLYSSHKLEEYYRGEQKRLIDLAIAGSEAVKDNEEPNTDSLAQEFAGAITKMAFYATVAQLEDGRANGGGPLYITRELLGVMSTLKKFMGPVALPAETTLHQKLLSDFATTVQSIESQYNVVTSRQIGVADFRKAIEQLDKLLSHLRVLKLTYADEFKQLEDHELQEPYGPLTEDEARRLEWSGKPLPPPSEAYLVRGIYKLAVKYAEEIEGHVTKRAGLAAFRFTVQPAPHKPSDFLKNTNPYSQAAVLSGAFMAALKQEGASVPAQRHIEHEGAKEAGAMPMYEQVMSLAKRLRGRIKTLVPQVEAKVLAARQDTAGLMYVGKKLHTEKPVDNEAFAELRDLFGLKNTGFKSIHAGSSLVGPIAPCSLEHKYMVRMLEILGMVNGNRPHLQTTLSGRLDADGDALKLLAPLLLLTTDTLDRFAPGAFSTTHDHLTDARIMAYDDGIRTGGHPFDRPNMEGRTDKLAGASLNDFDLHGLYGTLMHDLELGGPTAHIAREFFVPEALALLKKYEGRYQLDSARHRAQWVHDPRTQRDQASSAMTKRAGRIYNADGSLATQGDLLSEHEQMVNVFVDAWHDSNEGDGHLLHDAQQLLTDTWCVVKPVLAAHAESNPQELDRHMKF